MRTRHPRPIDIPPRDELAIVGRHVDDHVVAPVLPAQLEPLGRIYGLLPEARLALAVLEDAVATLWATEGASHPRAQRLRADTWAWFEGDEGDHVFSYRAVCDYLGLDADWIWEGLIRRPARRLSGWSRGRPPRRSLRPRTLRGRGSGRRVDRPTADEASRAS